MPQVCCFLFAHSTG